MRHGIRLSHRFLLYADSDEVAKTSVVQQLFDTKLLLACDLSLPQRNFGQDLFARYSRLDSSRLLDH